MTPENLVNVAKKKGLNGIAITDHNTIKGGVEARKRNKSDDFIIIIGSEIKTEVCEIIGLFLNEEISSTEPHVVIDAIRDQGGITVLPHPFRSFLVSHSNKQKKIPEELIERMDIIEVFNSRTRRIDNQKAMLLSSKMKKTMIAGSDAHFYNELGKTKVIIDSFDNEDNLRKNLQKGKLRIEITNNAFITVLPFIFLSGLYGRGRRSLLANNTIK